MIDREQIIAMAREADLVYWKPNSTFSDGFWWMDAGELGDELEHFAALIALRVSAAAKEEEREACAVIAETSADCLQNSTFEGVAIAIRARGKTK